MKGKWIVRAILLFAAYAAAMFAYIFLSDNSGVPQALQGTVADPSTFMTKRELYLSEGYSKVRNFLHFIITPFEWLVYLTVLLAGLSLTFERWGQRMSKWAVGQTAVYLFFLSLTTSLLMLPLKYVTYWVSKQYGLSTQPMSGWLQHNAIDFCFDFLWAFMMVSIIYFFIRRSVKRWWLYVWMATIPIMLFYMFLKPEIIDPLYNDFTPIANKELEEKILLLADEAGIPADHVYEVKMAGQTNTMNAYVTGIGSNTRIVLWDTTLQQLSEGEILFIMAHEMGHYVKKDVYRGMILYFAITFVAYWLVARLMARTIRRHGKSLNIQRMESIHSLPLYLLLSSVILFAADPLSNAISRHEEVLADRYALELVKNEEDAISTFQALAKSSLSETNPPLLVKWFRYSHPPLIDRIYNAKKQKQDE